LDRDARTALRSAALLVGALASALIGHAAPAGAAAAPDCAGIPVTLSRGGTLLGALLGAHVDRTQATGAVAAVEDLFDPRELRAGDTVCIELDPDTAGPRHLRSLHVSTARHQDLTVVAQSDGNFEPPRSPARGNWSLGVHTRSGDVAGDLRVALGATALPASVVDEVIVAFSHDPDLPLHPSPGSQFTVVYEALDGPRVDGEAAHLRYASLRSDGVEHRIYRYPLQGGDVAFVEPSGRGVVPVRLTHPVGDAPITSPWGWRIHPVLGLLKFHRGVDFVAPTGSPVRAAADGVLETIGWRGNYGRYVRLRHSEHVETAYAHLARFAQGLRPGDRIRRGEIIAYVGASGLATGPHLYYEVLIDHQQVDPQADGLAVPVQLAGNNLARFQTYLERVAADIAPRAPIQAPPGS